MDSKTVNLFFDKIGYNTCRNSEGTYKAKNYIKEREEMNPVLGAIETDEEFEQASALLDELLDELYAEEE